MELKHSISDYTETGSLEFVEKICRAEGATEKNNNKLVREFKRLTEHPDGSDLIYYPHDGREDSPEGIAKEIKEWRAANGKSGFKQGWNVNAGCLWMSDWHSSTTGSRYEKNNRGYFIAFCSHYSVYMSGKLHPGCSGRDRISIINSWSGRINNAITRSPLWQEQSVSGWSWCTFSLKCRKNSMWEMGSKIPMRDLSSRGRRFVVLSRSVFRTHETDRASLSCIVIQRAKNDSDAFFTFTLMFPCLFALLASKNDWGRFEGGIQRKLW